MHGILPDGSVGLGLCFLPFFANATAKMQNRKANTAAVLRENLMSVESSPILSVRSNQHLPGDDISCDVIEPVW